jgi:hypothetical protein
MHAHGLAGRPDVNLPSCGTSMIGNSQGEAEIPLDLAEGVLPTGKA